MTKRRRLNHRPRGPRHDQRARIESTRAAETSWQPGGIMPIVDTAPRPGVVPDMGWVASFALARAQAGRLLGCRVEDGVTIIPEVYALPYCRDLSGPINGLSPKYDPWVVVFTAGEEFRIVIASQAEILARITPAVLYFSPLWRPTLEVLPGVLDLLGRETAGEDPEAPGD